MFQLTSCLFQPLFLRWILQESAPTILCQALSQVATIPSMWYHCTWQGLPWTWRIVLKTSCNMLCQQSLTVTLILSSYYAQLCNLYPLTQNTCWTLTRYSIERHVTVRYNIQWWTLGKFFAMFQSHSANLQAYIYTHYACWKHCKYAPMLSYYPGYIRLKIVLA